MDQFVSKPVREDWTAVNASVEARVRELSTPRVPPPPVPVDWVQRGLGISTVVLAAGAAIAIVLWALKPAAHISGITSVLPRSASPTMPSILPGAPPPPVGKVVVDYTKFTTVSLPGREIVSGWKFNNSNEDTQPVFQYCYVSVKTTSVGAWHIDIANTTAGVFRFDPVAMTPLTESEFHTAVASCVWAADTFLPDPITLTPLPARRT